MKKFWLTLFKNLLCDCCFHYKYSEWVEACGKVRSQRWRECCKCERKVQFIQGYMSAKELIKELGHEPD